MEQRLNDAKALIDTFETKKAKAHEKSIKHLYGQNKNDKLYRKDCETESRCEYVLSVLRTTPTVDAVQVVRCGKCEYHGEPHRTDMGVDVVWCNFYNTHKLKDGYCNCGERKDEERRTE